MRNMDQSGCAIRPSSWFDCCATGEPSSTQAGKLGEQRVKEGTEGAFKARSEEPEYGSDREECRIDMNKDGIERLRQIRQISNKQAVKTKGRTGRAREDVFRAVKRQGYQWDEGP